MTNFVTEKEATGENQPYGKMCPELSNEAKKFVDCVGSRCMAWRSMMDYRQVPVDALPTVDTTGWDKYGERHEAIINTSNERGIVQTFTKKLGWCGKFGKPEE